MVPTDNTVVSTIQLIATLAWKAKKPIITCVDVIVGKGVLASAGGVDYHEQEKAAAELALEVLINQQRPDAILVQHAKSNKIVVHQETAQHLAITVPKTLTQKIEWK